ncbi:MAG: hypothetical protein AAGF67_02790 [Verrucomicrobiota bacterium]
MIGTLVRKEIQQHGVWLAILLPITLLVFLIIVFASLANGTGGGVFSGIGWGLNWFLIIPTYIVCHLLIASEFRSRSRIFLEGLPLSRLRLVVVKASFALGLGIALAVGAVLTGVMASAGSEAISPKFLGILFSSASLWAVFLVSFSFFLSFLGRYKIFVIIAIFLGMAVITSNAPFPMSAFPPFGLIHRFGFERDVWPLEDLWQTALISAGFLGAGFTIGLAREGSVAALLGEVMSYREKMLLGAGLAIVFFAISPFLENKAEPFRIPGAVEESFEGLDVFVSPEDIDRPIDKEVELASFLAREIAKRRDWLGIPVDDFPDIYVVENTGLEEEMIDWERVDGDRVVLMYAGYREPDFSRAKLLAYTMSVALSVHTFGRADQEHRWWLVCGIEGLWEMEFADEEMVKKRERVALDTIDEHGFSVERLMGRDLYADEAGWREADAVAWMSFRYLEETVGEEKVQELIRETVTRKVTRKDSRPSWREAIQNVPRVFRRTTGLSLEEFAEGAEKYIRAHPGEGVEEAEEGEES